MVRYDVCSHELTAIHLEDVFTKDSQINQLSYIRTSFRLEQKDEILKAQGYDEQVISDHDSISELLISNSICLLLNARAIQQNLSDSQADQTQKFLQPPCFAYKFRNSGLDSSEDASLGPKFFAGNNIVMLFHFPLRK